MGVCECGFSYVCVFETKGVRVNISACGCAVENALFQCIPARTPATLHLVLHNQEIQCSSTCDFTGFIFQMY